MCEYMPKIMNCPANVCTFQSLHWRHSDHGGVSNHQPHGCLLNRLFRRRSKKTSKLRVTGLCAGNSPGPVNSPRKGPVTRKMVPFDDVIIHFVPSLVQDVPNMILTFIFLDPPLCWGSLLIGAYNGVSFILRVRCFDISWDYIVSLTLGWVIFMLILRTDC